MWLSRSSVRFASVAGRTERVFNHRAAQAVTVVSSPGGPTSASFFTTSDCFFAHTSLKTGFPVAVLPTTFRPTHRCFDSLKKIDPEPRARRPFDWRVVMVFHFFLLSH